MNSQDTMEFTSKRYTKEMLGSMGVASFQRITCRKIDVNNQNFIDYHLYYMSKNSTIPIFGNDTYLIEIKNHESRKELAIVEILIFSNKNQRDRFALENCENFKLAVDNKVVYETLLLKYMN